MAWQAEVQCGILYQFKVAGVKRLVDFRVRQAGLSQEIKGIISCLKKNVDGFFLSVKNGVTKIFYILF